MSDKIHKVESPAGGMERHTEIFAKRPSAEFDVSQMSDETRAAFKRVCVSGGASPADYRHVFESILSRGVVKDILN